MGNQSDSDTLKHQMWKAMADSPFVMLGLEGSDVQFEPMTAVLDKHAKGRFWFFTKRGNRATGLGPAMAHFVARDHGLFACIRGRLEQETDSAVIDAHWSDMIGAWYEGGRNDPDMVVLRFELDDAEIWQSDPGLKGSFKLLTGQKVDPAEMGHHAEVTL